MHRNIQAWMSVNDVDIPVQIRMDLPGSEVNRDELHALRQRIQELENRFTNFVGDPWMRSKLSGIAAIIKAAQEGKRIQAIKMLREATPGLGLKEAKDLVESVWNSHLAQQAEQNSEPMF